VSQVPRFIFFVSLLSPAVGIGLYGGTFFDAQNPGGISAEERFMSEPSVSDVTQEPVVAGKADKQEVKAVAASNMADELMKPPVRATGKDEGIAAFDVAHKEIDPPPLFGEVNKEEVKRVVATDMADKKIEEPTVTRAAEQAKPISATRVVKKKLAAKHKKKKIRDQDRLMTGVPLILVPPQNVDKTVKPVSEDGQKVIQNFGLPKSSDHFRRK
jgi:hypothetical protein